MRTYPVSSKYEGESGMVSAANSATVARHNGALDGIRAVAILWVIMHNVGSVDDGPMGLALKIWALVSNAGWVGVQLFFALSGFLITRILLEGKGGAEWIGSFYARRFLRIVPLYFAFLFVMLLVAPRIPVLSGLVAPGHRTTLWFWLYMSNWIAPFGGLVAYMPHVWSLAVEEQFYLAWPLVIALLSERGVMRVCIAMTLSSLIARGLLHATMSLHAGSDAAYEFTIARWDTIALGALVALVVRDGEMELFFRRHLLLILGSICGAILAATAAQRGLPARGLFTEIVNQPLTGMFAAFLVFTCVARRSPSVGGARLQDIVIRTLSANWLAIIGKYSYAIYLFHSPIHRVLQPYGRRLLSEGGANERFVSLVAYCSVVLALSFGFALISWRLIEAPFLSLKSRFPMPAFPAKVDSAAQRRPRPSRHANAAI